jgi:cytoplasmic iron level regulating protein YaaA (DUF328/UPF0246 family)
MLLILSPSKTQSYNRMPHTPEPGISPLLDKSAELIGLLSLQSVANLGSLMKMSDKLARQTRERIVSFELPFTLENATPAIATFQGDVYSYIRIQDYNSRDIAFMQEHLSILSGLYGILRPLDLMQPYRLEMGCRLENPNGKNLYEFWGERITDLLREALASHKEQVLVNLASAEYSRVIKKKVLGFPMLDMEFKERKGDGYRIVAIHAKRARGMMVDFMVRKRVQQVTGLKEFAEAGYCYREELSTPLRYCFTREEAP